MRPLHPLPSPVISQISSSGKKKKRKIIPPTRARRQKIDPTIYGAVHLTEGMLQAHHIVIPPMEYLAETRLRSPAVAGKPLVSIPSGDREQSVSEEVEDEDMVPAAAV